MSLGLLFQETPSLEDHVTLVFYMSEESKILVRLNISGTFFMKTKSYKIKQGFTQIGRSILF